MSARVDAMPVRRPRYDNTDVRDFRAWYAANEPRLAQYFEQLGQFAAEPADDFFEFAVCQYDIERAVLNGR